MPRFRSLALAALVIAALALLATSTITVPQTGRTKIKSYQDLSWPVRAAIKNAVTDTPEKYSPTDASMRAGELLSKMMQETTHPHCDNFHESVCAGWRKLLEKPPHLTRLGVMTWMREQHRVRLQALLQDTTAARSSKHLPLLQSAYQQCVETAFPSSKGSVLLTALVNQWKALDFTRMETIGKAIKLNIEAKGNFLYRANVEPNNRKSTQMVIWLQQGGLTLGAIKSYTDVKQLERFQTLLDHLFRDFDIESAAGGVQPKDVLEFERALAAISIDPVTMRNPQLPKLTRKRSILVPFKKFIPVMTNAPSYFAKLPHLVKATPRSVIHAYFIVHQLLAVLPDFDYAPLAAFSADALHIRRPPVSDYCINSLSTKLPFLTAHAQIKHEFKDVESMHSVQDDMRAMIELIRSEYLATLARSQWLSPVMKERTIKKMKGVGVLVGAEEWTLDEDKVLDYYRNYRLAATWVESIWQFNLSNLRHEWSMLGKPNQRLFRGYPMQVNAFYSQSNNRIVIPFGILHPPMYHRDLPMSVKLAGIGLIVAHEFSHAIDARGRRYDWQGNLRDWWSTKIAAEYTKRERCFAQQYSGYLVHGQAVNGNLTLAENMADNIGTELVTSVAKLSSYTPTIPVIKPSTSGAKEFYTPEQVFFMYMASIWCLHVEPKAELHAMLRSVHAPSSARINCSVRNSREWETAFTCLAQEKCTLW
ncbi:hypothetical protein BC828DRAFT_414831 [Blastocladiella britannica]|nr:hypothetical protein BC828DRAFT_414831 [Blastocladiella britannica]